MKVVISCDELVEKSHVTEMVELFGELFPHSELYTLAHKIGAIPGKLEMRKIHSSFLSHKVKKSDDLLNYAFSIPTAAKNLFIPCSVDLIINISSGMSHGIRKCDKTKQITYFYGDNFLKNQKKGFFKKIFSSFTRNWALTQLEKADKVYFSTERLEKEYGDYCKEHSVIPPSFKLDDFKLFPKGMFNNDYALINAEEITPTEGEKVIKILEELELKYRFVGSDDHLKDLKKKKAEVFLGKKCVGEMAPIYAGSSFFIDFAHSSFPKSSLSCLATGRPVIVSDSPITRDVLKGEGVKFINLQDDASLRATVIEVQSQALEFDSAKLRAATNKFNEIRFKSKLKKEIDNLMK